MKLIGNFEGVLRISDDGFNKISIVVFYDRDKLTTMLPDSYCGYDVMPYDVRTVLRETKQFLAQLCNGEYDLKNEENKVTYDLFCHTIDICEAML